MSATITVRKGRPRRPRHAVSAVHRHGGGKIGGKRELLRTGFASCCRRPNSDSSSSRRRRAGLPVCCECSSSGAPTGTARSGGSRTSTSSRTGGGGACTGPCTNTSTTRRRDDPAICGIRLYTDEDNHGARRTYESVGMSGYMMELFETDFVYGPRPGVNLGADIARRFRRIRGRSMRRRPVQGDGYLLSDPPRQVGRGKGPSGVAGSSKSPERCRRISRGARRCWG